MKVQVVGYTEYGCPVFLVQTKMFRIQEFAKHSFSEAPVLILQYEEDEDDTKVAYVYGFTIIRRSEHMYQEWNQGKMEPFACLSQTDIETLVQIADSTAEQSVKDKRVQEVLKSKAFMHFGSGS